jgi:hypothetical protein
VILSVATALAADPTFAVTATPIPDDLLKLNYGKMPRGVAAFDLNICNSSPTKADLTSSQVYQAMTQVDASIQPIGGSIMLAAILRNQNNSVKSWVTIGLSSATGVLSVLGTTKSVNISSGWLNGIALGSLVGQSLLNTFSPVLTSDQVQTFQSQVLPPQMILDSGSCIERTVFVTSTTITKKVKRPLLNNMRMRISTP